MSNLPTNKTSNLQVKKNSREPGRRCTLAGGYTNDRYLSHEILPHLDEERFVLFVAKRNDLRILGYIQGIG